MASDASKAKASQQTVSALRSLAAWALENDIGGGPLPPEVVRPLKVIQLYYDKYSEWNFEDLYEYMDGWGTRQRDTAALVSLLALAARHADPFAEAEGPENMFCPIKSFVASYLPKYKLTLDPATAACLSGTLLSTHALQCFARLLAVASDRLHPAAEANLRTDSLVAAAEALQQEAPWAFRSTPRRTANASIAQLTQARRLLAETLDLLVCCGAQNPHDKDTDRASGDQLPSAATREALVTHLTDSHLVEHWCRLLLLTSAASQSKDLAQIIKSEQCEDALSDQLFKQLGFLDPFWQQLVRCPCSSYLLCTHMVRLCDALDEQGLCGLPPRVTCCVPYDTRGAGGLPDAHAQRGSKDAAAFDNALCEVRATVVLARALRALHAWSDELIGVYGERDGRAPVEKEMAPVAALDQWLKAKAALGQLSELVQGQEAGGGRGARGRQVRGGSGGGAAGPQALKAARLCEEVRSCGRGWFKLAGTKLLLPLLRGSASALCIRLADGVLGCWGAPLRAGVRPAAVSNGDGTLCHYQVRHLYMTKVPGSEVVLMALWCARAAMLPELARLCDADRPVGLSAAARGRLAAWWAAYVRAAGHPEALTAAAHRAPHAPHPAWPFRPHSEGFVGVYPAPLPDAVAAIEAGLIPCVTRLVTRMGAGAGAEGGAVWVPPDDFPAVLRSWWSTPGAGLPSAGSSSKHGGASTSTHTSSNGSGTTDGSDGGGGAAAAAAVVPRCAALWPQLLVFGPHEEVARLMQAVGRRLALAAEQLRRVTEMRAGAAAAAGRTAGPQGKGPSVGWLAEVAREVLWFARRRLSDLLDCDLQFWDSDQCGYPAKCRGGDGKVGREGKGSGRGGRGDGSEQGRGEGGRAGCEPARGGGDMQDGEEGLVPLHPSVNMGWQLNVRLSMAAVGLLPPLCDALWRCTDALHHMYRLAVREEQREGQAQGQAAGVACGVQSGGSLRREMARLADEVALGMACALSGVELVLGGYAAELRDVEEAEQQQQQQGEGEERGKDGRQGGEAEEEMGAGSGKGLLRAWREFLLAGVEPTRVMWAAVQLAWYFPAYGAQEGGQGEGEGRDAERGGGGGGTVEPRPMQALCVAVCRTLPLVAAAFPSAVRDVLAWKSDTRAWPELAAAAAAARARRREAGEGLGAGGAATGWGASKGSASSGGGGGGGGGCKAARGEGTARDLAAAIPSLDMARDVLGEQVLGCEAVRVAMAAGDCDSALLLAVAGDMVWRGTGEELLRVGGRLLPPISDREARC